MIDQLFSVHDKNKVPIHAYDRKRSMYSRKFNTHFVFQTSFNSLPIRI